MAKSKLERAVEKIVSQLDEQEKRQDAVLRYHREVIRDCAKAIKNLHAGEKSEAEELLKRIEAKVGELKKLDAGFEHISESIYQEYAEVRTLEALLAKKEPPTYEELGIPFSAWLSGLADVVGELRRALHNALRSDDRKEAEYLFGRMEELYDNLAVIKYSGSLVGALKRKQDMVRHQLQEARGEMLRAR
jgi:translin